MINNIEITVNSFPFMYGKRSQTMTLHCLKIPEAANILNGMHMAGFLRKILLIHFQIFMLTFLNTFILIIATHLGDTGI